MVITVSKAYLIPDRGLYIHAEVSRKNFYKRNTLNSIVIKSYFSGDNYYIKTFNVSTVIASFFVSAEELIAKQVISSIEEFNSGLFKVSFYVGGVYSDDTPEEKRVPYVNAYIVNDIAVYNASLPYYLEIFHKCSCNLPRKAIDFILSWNLLNSLILSTEAKTDDSKFEDIYGAYYSLSYLYLNKNIVPPSCDPSLTECSEGCFTSECACTSGDSQYDYLKYYYDTLKSSGYVNAENVYTGMIISLFSKLKWLSEDIEYVSDSYREYLIGSDVKIENITLQINNTTITYKGNTAYSVIAHYDDGESIDITHLCDVTGSEYYDISHSGTHKITAKNAGASVDNTQLLITPTGTQNVVTGNTVNFSVVKAERTTRLSSPQRIIPIVAYYNEFESEPVTLTIAGDSGSKTDMSQNVMWHVISSGPFGSLSPSVGSNTVFTSNYSGTGSVRASVSNVEASCIINATNPPPSGKIVTHIKTLTTNNDSSIVLDNNEYCNFKTVIYYNDGTSEEKTTGDGLYYKYREGGIERILTDNTYTNVFPRKSIPREEYPQNKKSLLPSYNYYTYAGDTFSYTGKAEQKLHYDGGGYKEGEVFSVYNDVVSSGANTVVIGKNQESSLTTTNNVFANRVWISDPGVVTLSGNIDSAGKADFIVGDNVGDSIITLYYNHVAIGSRKCTSRGPEVQEKYLTLDGRVTLEKPGLSYSGGSFTIQLETNEDSYTISKPDWVTIE